MVNLSIVEIAIVRPDRLAVRFSRIPRSTSPSRSKDALRPEAYRLLGPGSVSVRLVSEDLSDLTRLELQLSGPMTPGSWQLMASDIASPAADDLIAQSVPFSYPSSELPPRAGDSSSYDIIAQAVGPAMTGPNWSAIIKALGWSAQLDSNYAEFALDQLFLAAASERWLSKRAAEIGLTRSPVSGISDEAFRYLATSYGWGKLIQPGLLSMLDAIWGPDLTRATAPTELQEPFSVFGGEDLVVRAGGAVRLLTIPVGSVATPGAATALELAMAMSAEAKRVGLPAYFDVVRSSSGSRVRAVTDGIGLEAKLTFLGGSAQPALRFPQRIGAFSLGAQPTWIISFVPLSAATSMVCVDPTGEDLSEVRAGDYVTIYGSEFLPANRGTFAVISIEITISGGSRTQTLLIANPDGVAQVVTQAEEGSLLVFRPYTIVQPPAGPILTQATGGLSVVLPTTSLVVRRDLLSAGYVQDGGAIVGSASRLDGVVTFAAPGHPVSAGETIDVGRMTPSFSDAPITPGGGSLSAYSAKSIWADGPNMTDPRSDHTAVGLPSGGVLVAGGWDGTSYLSSAEIFSVSSETAQPDGGRQLTSSWTAAAPRPISASKSCGVRLATTDSILMVGGYDGAPRAESHLYDELTDAWISTPDAPGARYDSVAITPAPKVAWITGGNDGVSATSSLYAYDLSSNSWAVGPNMIYARERHASTHSSDTVLVSGGLDASGSPTATCETSSYSSPAWALAGAMAWARYGHSLVHLPDGRVAAIGGLGRPADSPAAAVGPIAEVEVFDFSTRSWSSGGALAEPIGLGVSGYVSGAVWTSGGGASRTYRRGGSGAWARSTAGGVGLTGAATHFSAAGWAVACGSSPPSSAAKILIPNREITQWRGIERFLIAQSVSPGVIVAKESWPTGEVSFWSGVEIRLPLKAARPGPYIFSPNSSMVAGSSIITLDQDVAEGESYSILSVIGSPPASPGWLALDLGGPSESGPIEYLGPAAAGFIRVNFVAPRAVSAGKSISFLWGKGPYDPPASSSIQKVFCAPSDAPTAEMADLMLQVSGGGLPRSVSVRYPSDAGLGGQGYPTSGVGKLSDSTKVWSGK